MTLKDAEQVVTLRDRPKRHRADHPKGWEPGITWNPEKGGIVTVTADAEPDPALWAFLIEDWDLDPSVAEIVPGTWQVRAWDANVGDGNIQRLKYYRATLRPRSAEVNNRVDIEALCKMVEKRKAAKPPKFAADNGYDARSWLVALSDWQLGKGEGGGSAATAQRILDAAERTVHRGLELRKVGRGAETVVLAGVGDIVEGCSGWYPMQTWQADLTDREQDRLARRLLLCIIDMYIDAQYRVITFGVAGNHGENRQDGKAYTDFSDNRDIACFETVGEIMAANPTRYADVSVPLHLMNPDDLTMTLDLSGIPVSFAHGHQFRTGSNAQAKMENWWKGQAMGRTGVCDAEILICGHLHHHVSSEALGRTVIQVPAMDGGSKWFLASSGQSAPPGMLAMGVGTAYVRSGYGDKEIL